MEDGHHNDSMYGRNSSRAIEFIVSVYSSHWPEQGCARTKKTHITRSIASEHIPEKWTSGFPEYATTQEATDGFGTNDA
jgi:hypothetical protein